MHGGRTMKKYSEAFVGVDTAKKKHAVAIADVGRDGEVRYFGEIDSAPAAIEKRIGKSAERHATLHVCDEAGSTGDGSDRRGRGSGSRRHGCRALADPTEARRADRDQPP